MKKLLLVLLMFSFGVANADEFFIISDQYETKPWPSLFKVELNGVEGNQILTKDGMVYYNITALPIGNYIIKAAFGEVYGDMYLWSEWSVPFIFVMTVAGPTTPVNPTSPKILKILRNIEAVSP